MHFKFNFQCNKKNSFSSSYPDQKEGEGKMDVDDEVEEPANLEGSDYQLVLPSGLVVGHRSLMR